jgi:hypothetical protein
MTCEAERQQVQSLKNQIALLQSELATAVGAARGTIVKEMSALGVKLQAAQQALATCVRQSLPNGPQATGSQMTAGQVLRLGTSISSPSGVYSLTLQADGNLVLYRADGKPLWSAGTGGQSVVICLLADSGALQLFTSDAVNIWSSSGVVANSTLRVNDDGNVALYDPNQNIVWQTGTTQPVLPTGPTATGDTMQAGQILDFGNSLESQNFEYQLVFGTDGDLILNRDVGSLVELWSSGTNQGLAFRCVMQADGNLVIYDRYAAALWQSGTAGHANCRLVVQGDGNLVIYDSAGAIWDTKTGADFSLTTNPSSVTVPAGDTTNTLLRTVSQRENAGQINLGVESFGLSARATIDPSYVQVGGIANVAVQTGVAVSPGAYPVVFAGTADGLIRTTVFTINVAPAETYVVPMQLVDGQSYLAPVAGTQYPVGVISSLTISQSELPIGTDLVYSVSHKDSKGTVVTIVDLEGNTNTSAFNTLTVAGNWTVTATLNSKVYNPKSLSILGSCKLS